MQDRNQKAFDNYKVTQEALDRRAKLREIKEIKAALRAAELAE
jgi:hypothetical protein